METRPQEPEPEPFRVQETRRHGMDFFEDHLTHFLGEAAIHPRPDYFDFPDNCNIAEFAKRKMKGDDGRKV